MFNSYEIYLRGIPDIDTFKFPVNPIGEFTINVRNKYETVDVFGLGEVLLKRNKTLQEFGWKSLFPANEEERMVLGNDSENDRTALENIQIFKKLTNELLYLIINIKDENGDIETYINEPVMFKELSTQDKGGEPGDIYYSIKFVHNIIPTIKKREIIPPTPTTPAFIPQTGGGGGNQNPVPKNKYNIGDYIEVTGPLHEKGTFINEFSDDVWKYLQTTTAYKWIQDPSKEPQKQLLVQQGKARILKIVEGVDIEWGRLYKQAQGTEPVTKEDVYIEEFFYIELKIGIDKVKNIFSFFSETLSATFSYIKNAIFEGKNKESDREKAVAEAAEIKKVYVKKCFVEKKISAIEYDSSGGGSGGGSR